MSTPWNHRCAQRMQSMKGSAIRELLKLADSPDIISFAGGMPAPEVFPVEAFRAASDRVLARQGKQALQYSATEGYRPLREWIARKMAQYGIESAPENVLITSGSQQALDLLGKILINPGDLILTEKPTYLGALQAWRAYQAEFTTVPIDENGLIVDSLEEALTAGPKFMYILPNFHNPGGVTLSLERRHKLIEFSDRYGIPIIEDDPYGELRYEGEHIPPLVVIDSERLKHRLGHGKDGINYYDETAPVNGNGRTYMRGNVIYLSTFSKTLAPGLRLAWVVAPAEVIHRCTIAKQGMDLHTATMNQIIAHGLLTGGEEGDDFLKGHVRLIREVYRDRRDAMLDAMERYFPDGVTWTRPAGGLFLWVTLPEFISATELLEKAVEHKVAFVPGNAFHPHGDGRNSLRLNFSFCNPEKINTGIKRLGMVIREAIEEHSTHTIDTDAPILHAAH
ncbi:MAG: PLP-dependent aminotransferase family protein [Candidatus Promineofilum sp.]|nr:PLP-dependent aminotransferase family protein [Promineifilum sp.]